MSSRTGAEPSFVGRRLRDGGAAALRLLLGGDERMAVRIRFAFIPMLLYVAWAVFYSDAGRLGAMSPAGVAVMIAIQLIGMAAFYPLVRCGLTRRLQDAGLVLPQMLWASMSTVVGMAFAPTLRAPLLQVLCMIQLFGFFSLRPPQLLVTGCAAVGFLVLLFGLGALGWVPGFDAADEIVPILLTGVALVLLTRITIVHSRRRGLLATQKAELGKAVAAVQELVVRDALTGLYNRRHMESVLAEERSRSLTSGVPFSVALLDIDHFKRINDGHGHAAGDAVLCHFAQALGASLRSIDTVARWGGEEFLVLAPGSGEPVQGTLRLPLARLRAILAHGEAAPPAGVVPVTFSAGLAAWRPDESAHQTIARADEALYAAKAGGRDRLVMADTAEERRADAAPEEPVERDAPVAAGR